MILSDISNLSYGSNKLVEIQCELCLKKRFTQYRNAYKYMQTNEGKTLCRKCATSSEFAPTKRASFRKLISERFKGISRSDEVRKKISLGKLGDKNPMKRKEVSEKVSKFRIGKFLGQENPNWKPPSERYGPLSEGIRSLKEYVAWRTSVFLRDNRKCVLCGSNNQIEADHITPLSFLIKENNIKTKEEAILCSYLWDTNNGRTLCHQCHTETDTYLSKAKSFK